MMKRLAIAVLGATALTFAGCAGDRAAQRSEPQDPAEQEQPSPHGEQAAIPMCPMHLPQVSVKAEHSPHGAVLVFTTEDEAHVQALRQSVQHLATAHLRPGAGPGEGTGGAGPGHKGCCPGHEGKAKGQMASAPPMPPLAHALTEEVDKGAKVVFVPQDPARMEELRASVRARAELMGSGRCPMQLMQQG
jgi:hypothetical protein